MAGPLPHNASSEQIDRYLNLMERDLADRENARDQIERENQASKHSWGELVHNRRDGFGVFGGHWGCKNKSCRYSDGGYLYHTMDGSSCCKQ